MKDFFNKMWVKITAWCMLIIGTLALILGGTSVGEIVQIPELVYGIVQAVGILIIAISKLLQKKATDGK